MAEAGGGPEELGEVAGAGAGTALADRRAASRRLKAASRFREVDIRSIALMGLEEVDGCGCSG